MQNLILVGKILKPQGIKGEIKVKPIIDNLDRFSKFDYFFVGKNKNKMAVDQINVRFGYAYVTFVDVKTRNDAELLRNSQLFVDRDSFGAMEEDSYLLDDLIGLDIVYENEDFCAGSIVDIEQFGSADIIHVLNNKGKVYQLPFIKTIFKHVDLSRKRIIVDKSAYEEMKI